jgi:ABC-type bacteriocin/lantibiotic exporter with double-glycine peptidase domain
VGKTTLVNLIMGSLTPTQGEVLISSLPPRKAFSLWPGKVSYISQHEQPIIGTIRSNLLYGISEDIPDSVLWKSLRLADIDDFVGELPYKLETNLTDMASNLSGGQSQRINLARALITEPRLLVLDEATSGLDLKTEKLIFNTLLRFPRSVTILLITHRVHSLEKLDHIYMLEDSGLISRKEFSELNS